MAAAAAGAGAAGVDGALLAGKLLLSLFDDWLLVHDFKLLFSPLFSSSSSCLECENVLVRNLILEKKYIYSYNINTHFGKATIKIDIPYNFYKRYRTAHDTCTRK